jgi:F-type H+-transporting ATPase subunit a
LLFVGILEVLADFSKMISFAFRLFGNIFAGEVLLVIMAFLAPLAGPLPFFALELFVGLVQALVFTMLTLVFLQIASAHHGETATEHTNH